MDYILIALLHFTNTASLATVQYHEYEQYRNLGIFKTYSSCQAALETFYRLNTNKQELACVKKDA